MAIYGLDAQIARIAMPAPGGTVNSVPYTVPEVWGDTSGFNTTNGTTQAASPIWEGFVTTMPIAFLGGGVQRLVASADQSGAPTTIGLIFHMGGG